MAKILIYTTPICPYCVRAKQVFKAKGVSYEEIDISTDADARADMMQKSGRRTVPQIWIGDVHVGGCDDLLALQADGKLDALLNS